MMTGMKKIVQSPEDVHFTVSKGPGCCMVLCKACCNSGKSVATLRSAHWKLVLLVLLLLSTSHLIINILSKNGQRSLFTVQLNSESQATISDHLKHGSEKMAKASMSSSAEEALQPNSAASNSSSVSHFKLKNLLSNELPQCPPVPPNLVGKISVSVTAVSIPEEEKKHPELLAGGHFMPENCQARHKVAIIIPYRDREDHLSIWLHHMHSFLQKQQLDYTIFVVEQSRKDKFNRAQLMNVGALESLKLYPFQCFIFHDVDLLPEDDRNIYSCPQQPRHMSVAIDTLNYRLPYKAIFGGVSAMSTGHYKQLNGFSNKYWGWGGEDDDMSNRITHNKLYISRYPANIARYKMLSHKKDTPNPNRFKTLYEGKKRFMKDGANSCKYRVLDLQLRKLYTWINVELIKS